MTHALPPSWATVPLGSVLSRIEAGASFRCEERPPREQETGVVKVSAVTWGEYDEEESKTVLSSDRIDERFLIRPGDFLFSRANTISLVGACVIARRVNRRVMLSDKILRFHFAGAEPAYVLHFLRSPAGRSEIERLSTGNQESMRNIGQDRIRAIELPLPPLAEQRRIVAAIEEHLSALNAAVAGVERARANLRRYRSAVQDAAIHAGADRWRWTTFGEHITSLEAGSSFRCIERPPEPDEVGVVKVSAVTWGRYDEDESKTVMNSERIDERLLVRPGDFLFSRANTIKLVGACVIAKQVTRRVMLSDKILRLCFRDLDPRWALLVLRSAHGRSEIERLATGNQESMRNIGQERIRAIRIPVPSDGEQNEIVTEVESRLAVADRTAAEIDVQLARAVRLRQAILQRAFSGRLVPQDATDEPASVHLSRTGAADPATAARPRRARTPA